MRVSAVVPAILLVTSLVARPAAAQQTYGTNFDSFETLTLAEDLTVPGLTFSSTPPQNWFVLPAQTLGFVDLTGQMLIQPDPGSLDVTFPSVRTVSLVFAMDALIGQSSLVAQAYSGETLVAQVTQRTSVAGANGFGEGTLVLSSATPFTRIRLSALPADTLIAIDDLFAYSNEVCVPPTQAPVITSSPSTPIVAGRSFTLAWQPVLGLSESGFYVVETSFSSGFSPIDATFQSAATSALIPTLSSASGLTLYARVRGVQACGQAGPNSTPVGFSVSAAPASFAATVSSVTLTTSVGKVPTPGSATFRNVGGTAGTLALSVSGGLQLDRASLSLSPGQSGSVGVSAPAGLVGSAGSIKGTLTAAFSDQKLTVPVALTVTGSVTTDRTGTRVAPSLATVTFTAPTGQNPAPRTVTLAVGPITGSGAVYLVPSVGPGGAWLDLSGDFTRPVSTPSTVNLTLSVNRSARSAEDGVAPFRTLVRVKADGASDDDAAVIEVIDLEPATVVAGTDRNASLGRVPEGARSWRTPRAPLAVQPPAGGLSFIVPSAVKATGSAGAQFSSDGWLKNQASVPVPASFYFTPDGKDGLTDASVLKSTRTLPAGATFRLSELLPAVFGVADVSGQVEIRSPDTSSLTLRTSVESVTGGDATSRYGTEIPTVAYGSGVGIGGGELVLPGIDDDASNRSNLILTETTGNAVTVQVTVTNSAGQQLGSTSVSLKPYSKTQINELVKTIAGTTLSGGWAGITVTAGTGKVAAVATVIDNRSNSFSAVKGRAPGIATTVSGRSEPLAVAAVTAGASLVVPSAARLTGAFNTQYTTSLSMVNGTATNAILTLTYNYIDVEDGNKAKSVTKSVTLPPRGAFQKALGKDVVADFFGIRTPSYGWMKVDGDASRIVALSAISALVDANDATKGVKTSQVDGVLTSSPDVMGKQELERRFSGAEKSVQRRTNVIFVEVTGQPCDVLLSLNGANGSPLAQKTVTVQGNQYLQINDVFGPNGLDLGDGPFQNTEVTARVLSGDGRIIGVATVIDNVSRNPEVWVMKPAGTPTPSISF